MYDFHTVCLKPLAVWFIWTFDLASHKNLKRNQTPCTVTFVHPFPTVLTNHSIFKDRKVACTDSGWIVLCQILAAS